jgi:hypothetical protein
VHVDAAALRRAYQETMMQHATRPAALGDTVRAASRQMWLAGLGAVVVTREWAEKEAGSAFRALVREGTAVESRAMRVVSDRLDTSVARADALWRQARSTVEGAVKGYADGAVSLVRRTLPQVELAAAPVKAKPLKPARPARTTRRAKAAKRTVRTSKRATRR